MNSSIEIATAEKSTAGEAYNSPCVQKLGRIGTVVEASSMGSGADAGIYAS